jgi:hypothetical protein
MGIEEPELVDVVHKLEVLEQKLGSHPLHKVCLVMTFQLRNVQCLFFFSDPLSFPIFMS